MIRSVAFLAYVLSTVAPSFQPRQEAARYLSELGAKHGFDALTLVAIVKGESDWRPGIVSKNGRDFGLAQIRATNFRECRPSTYDEKSCDWRKQSLLHWRMNLMLAANMIQANREYCNRLVGDDMAIHWLQAFQGYDSNRGTVCGHVRRHGRWFAMPVPALTRKVLAERKRLAGLRP